MNDEYYPQQNYYFTNIHIIENSGVCSYMESMNTVT